MKKILPSLRRKRRYMVFEFSEPVGKEDALRSILGSIHSLYGDVGASEICPKLVEFDGVRGILKCAHTKVEDVRAALACIYEVGGKKLSVRVLGISGTIRGAKEKFIGE